MKQFICWLLFSIQFVVGQTITIDEVNEAARNNYPLIKQNDLLNKIASINMDNLSKGFLPQVNISGQASYQSDVTKVTISVPGVSITAPAKDQYKIIADMNQLIYDGGMVRDQKNLQLLNARMEEQTIEVELYKLRERVNLVFLNVLYLDEQLKQVELIRTDLQTGQKKVEAQVNNGVAFRSNLNVLKAELLKTEQRVIEIRSSRKGLLDLLGVLIHRDLPERTELSKPTISFFSPDTVVARPELNYFSSRQKFLLQQDALIDSRNKPKASLFVQGGYGRPALNLLKNEFNFFYLGGIRLNWSLSGLYTRKNDKQLMEINRKTIDIQKDVFLLNIQAQLKQQAEEIIKLDQLIATDQEIIALRLSIKDAAKAQLENGVITANDYLREVNAEDQSRQNMITHQLQLLQAKINYKTITGKI